jgi:hypothetical protein
MGRAPTTDSQKGLTRMKIDPKYRVFLFMALAAIVAAVLILLTMDMGVAARL